jgi:hypothetical protein
LSEAAPPQPVVLAGDAAATVEASVRPGGDVLREMARGGLAGLIVGLVVGGLGGRLLMRFAALVEPDAAGLRTENGNVIGAITADGTLALLLFGGLFTGAIVGALWVVIRPWLPRRPLVRAVVAIPVCVAMGTTLLIQSTNPDFVILRRNAGVIAALVGLVALVGPSMVLAESILERVLPVVNRRRSIALAAYAVIDAIGAFLVLSLVVPLFLLGPLVIAGIGLVIVGIASVVHWAGRLRGAAEPAWLALVARTSLAAATVAGLAVAIPEILGAANLA